MVGAAQHMNDRNRFMWSLGDYQTIADILRPAAEAVVDACDVRAGTSLLDVGAGTGNLAVEAAKRGARVIASDLTPHLIESEKSVDRPSSWGTVEAARGRFEPVAAEVDVRRGSVEWDFASPEEARGHAGLRLLRDPGAETGLTIRLLVPFPGNRMGRTSE